MDGFKTDTVYDNRTINRDTVFGVSVKKTTDGDALWFTGEFRFCERTDTNITTTLSIVNITSETLDEMISLLERARRALKEEEEEQSSK